MKPDVLAGLSAPARRRRERADAEYLAAASATFFGNAESITSRDMLFAGNPALAPPLKPYKPGQELDAVICARVDLDHPIYFDDNRFADCADCGCRVQYRPHAPDALRLCICCAARRTREER